MKRFPVISFILATYTLSWSLWFLGDRLGGLRVRFSFIGLEGSLRPTIILEFLGAFAPGIVALVLLSSAGEIKQAIGRFCTRRIGIQPYAVALFLPASLAVSATLLDGLLAGVIRFPTSSILWFPYLVAVNILLTPFWEELGWRGYLLPKLQERYGGLQASLLVGAVWGIWHLPIRLYPGPSGLSPLAFFALFLANIIALSILFTWLYNFAQGSLLPVILFHSSVNASSDLIVQPDTAAYGVGMFFALSTLTWIVAVIVVLSKRRLEPRK